jgi:hypothetical protein
LHDHHEINSKTANTLEKACSAGNIYGQNLANTVLLATVLLFATMSGKFEQQRVRAIAFAVAVFLFAIVRTVMLPI